MALSFAALFSVIGMPSALAQIRQEGKPDAEDLRMQAKVPAYLDVVKLAAHKLINKDTDGFVALINPAVVKRIGREKFTRMVNLVFVPFFSDYRNDSGDLRVCAAQGSGGEKGLSFYPQFITATGAKKCYVITVMESHGKPVVEVLLPNNSFSQDHPDVEAERRANRR